MFVAAAACFLLPVVSPARWVRKFIFKTPLLKEYDNIIRSNLWNILDLMSWLLLILTAIWVYGKMF